jgi:hypothetical protein
VAKAASGRTLLFVSYSSLIKLTQKYAPYPERKGYLFAATDLETVYFEAVFGASVATRVGEVGEQEGKDVDTGMEQAEAALQSLSDAFDGGWGSASMDTRTDDDYFVSAPGRLGGSPPLSYALVAAS